jgi:hypothetical protein
VPSAIVLRYTRYPVTPLTDDQLTEILLDDVEFADTSDGGGRDVVAEAGG